MDEREGDADPSRQGRSGPDPFGFVANAYRCFLLTIAWPLGLPTRLVRIRRSVRWIIESRKLRVGQRAEFGGGVITRVRLGYYTYQSAGGWSGSYSGWRDPWNCVWVPLYPLGLPPVLTEKTGTWWLPWHRWPVMAARWLCARLHGESVTKLARLWRVRVGDPVYIKVYLKEWDREEMWPCQVERIESSNTFSCGTYDGPLLIGSMPDGKWARLPTQLPSLPS